MRMIGNRSLSSITTQMTAIVAVSVLLGMTLSVAIVVLFFADSRPQDSAPFSTFQAVQMTQLLQAARDQADAATIVRTARGAGIDVAIMPIRDLRPQERTINVSFSNWRISRRLNSTSGIEVLEGLRDPSGSNDQIIIKIDPSNALVFNVNAKSDFWRYILTPASMLLMIVLTFVLLISAYAVRWITAPLGTLANAAVSFGLSPREEHIVQRRGPREIAQVADALNEMRTRIRALLDDRTRMLAAISHDLRTPLTRLRLRSERVADEGLREAMLSDLTKISHMIDDTLRYLREDAGQEPISRTDLPSLLQTVCSDFSDVGNDVTYHGPARLAYTCKPKELGRALTNIVENGTKHSTAVEVHLDHHEDFVRIRVCDNGPGLADELREKVFEPFFKADDARGQNAGFGLGLSIARDIVRRHHGRLTKDQGLEVSIRLPIKNT